MLNYIKNHKLPLLLWSTATLFFAFQFILRLIPSLIGPEIKSNLHISQVDFGVILSVYYIGYSVMQIPLGIMLDRFNYRYVSFAAISTCMIGNLIFGYAETSNMFVLGRFLIGCGSAVGFLAVTKIIKLFFAEKHQGMMIGLSFTFGLIGAVFGNKPMVLILNIYDYRSVLLILSVIGFLIALLILITKSKSHMQKRSDNEIGVLKAVQKVFFNPVILIVGISGGLMVGTLEGFADFWSIQYFMQILHFSKEEASQISGYIFWGMCVGGPVLVYLAKIFRSDIFVISLTAILMTFVFMAVFYFLDCPFFVLCIMMFLLGILCCYQVLVFNFVISLVNPNLSTMAIAVTNCINMSFGSLFHTILSYLMESNWNGAVDHSTGIALYDYYTFVVALSVIPIAAMIGQVGFLYANHKHNKRTASAKFGI